MSLAVVISSLFPKIQWVCHSLVSGCFELIEEQYLGPLGWVHWQRAVSLLNTSSKVVLVSLVRSGKKFQNLRVILTELNEDLVEFKSFPYHLKVVPRYCLWEEGNSLWNKTFSLLFICLLMIFEKLFRCQKVMVWFNCVQYWKPVKRKLTTREWNKKVMEN